MSEQARIERQDSQTADGRQSFDALLSSLKRVIIASVDEPADPLGEWFFDIEVDGFSTSVTWRHDRGYGIFSSGKEGIGDRPDEVFRDAFLAARRLMQLAQATKERRNPRMRLSDVRRLINERQTELAGRLNVGQGVISRLENRHDAKLSTISDYVEALGGRAVLMVRFDDFEAPIDIDLAAPHCDETPRAICV